MKNIFKDFVSLFVIVIVMLVAANYGNEMNSFIDSMIFE